MKALRPPCLSGAAAMFMRGPSLDGSAAATFKRGGGHVREGPPLESPATRVEAGCEGLRGGVFHPGPAGDFPGPRPWLLGPGSDAGVPGGGRARSFTALAALPTDAVLGGPGPGLHGEPGPRGKGRQRLPPRAPGAAALGWIPRAGPHLVSGTCVGAPGPRSTDEAKALPVLAAPGPGPQGPFGPGDTSLRARCGPPPGTAHFLIRDAGTTRSSQIN